MSFDLIWVQSVKVTDLVSFMTFKDPGFVLQQWGEIKKRKKKEKLHMYSYNQGKNTESE